MNKTKSKRQAWILAIRPKTLPAAVSPVIVGVAFAANHNSMDLLNSAACLIGAVLLQILSNLANDYYDFLKGYDTEKRVGPTRVVASGLISPKELQIGMVINILLIVLSGTYLLITSYQFVFLQVRGTFVLLGIGLLSIIFAVLYSGGPFPLSALGLGDVFVFLFFGIVAVNGTFFANTGYFNLTVLIGSFAPGFLITAILVVNNYRDYEEDVEAGKKTLVARFGPRFGRVEYIVLIVLAYLVPPVVFGSSPYYHILTLLPSISSPLAFSAIKRLVPDTPRAELNILLADTAKLSLIFSILFAIGVAL